ACTPFTLYLACAPDRFPDNAGIASVRGALQRMDDLQNRQYVGRLSHQYIQDANDVLQSLDHGMQVYSYRSAYRSQRALAWAAGR
ncbi:hypothetical protein LCGC14_1316900, partial [marine sediment metagenome]